MPILNQPKLLHKNFCMKIHYFSLVYSHNRPSTVMNEMPKRPNKRTANKRRLIWTSWRGSCEILMKLQQISKMYPFSLETVCYLRLLSEVFSANITKMNLLSGAQCYNFYIFLVFLVIFFLVCCVCLWIIKQIYPFIY